jgi:hypothetical protein
MSDPFFDHHPEFAVRSPARHWELNTYGQPTHRIIDSRRRAEFITPIPKPKKRKVPAAQQEMILDEGKGLSTQKQQYDITSIINEVRSHVETWRNLPPSGWHFPASLKTHGMGRASALKGSLPLIPSPRLGHAKVPRSKRLLKTHKPLPSQ